MDDYKFLEEIGRFVADKGKLLHDKQIGGGKGKGKAVAQGSAGKEPEWVRKARQAGIEVVLLRDGMERRTQNSSKYAKK